MKRSFAIPCLFTIAVLILSGCKQFSEVKPTGARKIAGNLKVEPAIHWNSFSRNNNEVWTVDGTLLNALSFLTAIDDKKSLLAEGTPGEPPVFKKGMREGDIVDLYEATLIFRKFSQVQTTGLRPAEVSGKPAFRFDFSAFDPQGLAKRGTVLGVIDDDGRLNLVIYQAAKEHYYDLYIDKVEAIMASVELI